MHRWTKIMVVCGLVVACGLISAPSARANTIQVFLQGGSPTPEAGNFRWSYDAYLTPQATARTGDFFNIFDFAGLIPGSNLQPAGWSFASPNSGPCPASETPTCTANDDSTITNLVWTRTGADISNVNPPAGALLFLGTFSALSKYNVKVLDSYVDITRNDITGQAQGHNDTTFVPTVPEPGSMFLLGTGLFGLAGAVRRRFRGTK